MTSTTSQTASETVRSPRDITTALWMLITGIIGSMGSYLLMYERVLLWQNPDHITACNLNIWISCGEVMQSWQASTFGFPNIFIGIVGFPLVIFAALTVFTAGRRIADSRAWWLVMQAGATFAFAMTLWLWYSAVYMIGVLCPYCMIVWVGAVFLFFSVTARNITHGAFGTVSASVRTIASQWWWVAALLVLLGFILSILLQFPIDGLFNF